MFARTGLLAEVGEQNIFWSADQAIVAIDAVQRDDTINDPASAV
jgi:hypothetical protein